MTTAMTEAEILKRYGRKGVLTHLPIKHAERLEVLASGGTCDPAGRRVPRGGDQRPAARARDRPCRALRRSWLITAS